MTATFNRAVADWRDRCALRSPSEDLAQPILTEPLRESNTQYFSSRARHRNAGSAKHVGDIAVNSAARIAVAILGVGIRSQSVQRQDKRAAVPRDVDGDSFAGVGLQDATLTWELEHSREQRAVG